MVGHILRHNIQAAKANNLVGILMNLPPPNSHQSSQKPISLRRMVNSTVLMRRMRRRRR
jgi:hypothetical protein